MTFLDHLPGLKRAELQPELPNLTFIGAAFAAFVFLMLAGLAVPRGNFVLVVARPGTSEAATMDIIARAGGTFVSQGNYGWLAVAHAENSGFAGRLLKAGAFLVLDHSLAAGCLERNER
jgi:hypothetical protein